MEPVLSNYNTIASEHARFHQYGVLAPGDFFELTIMIYEI